MKIRFDSGIYDKIQELNELCVFDLDFDYEVLLDMFGFKLAYFDDDENLLDSYFEAETIYVNFKMSKNMKYFHIASHVVSYFLWEYCIDLNRKINDFWIYENYYASLLLLSEDKLSELIMECVECELDYFETIKVIYENTLLPLGEVERRYHLCNGKLSVN